MKTITEIFTVNKTSNRLAIGTIAVVLFTSIHHIYGGYQYDTSWRIIMPIFFFLPMLLFTLFLQYRVVKNQNVITLIFFSALVFIGWIGALAFGEGGYNHLLKNILYFGNASEELLTKMFPPEFGSTKLYEKPNDWFFESTGIFTMVFGFYISHYMIKFIKNIRNVKKGVLNS
jgi:hypothetical protein